MTQEELAELRARNDAIFKAQNEEWEQEKLDIKNNKKVKENQGIENKNNSTNNSNKSENVDAFFVGIPMGPAVALVLFFIFFYLLR
ncbi:hypothetical protein ACOTWK_00135 [Aliarcobacter butzleri]